MSEVKFTPSSGGLWKAIRVPQHPMYLSFIGIYAFILAPEGDEEQEANARLIATAPEMDEALQLLVAAIKEIDKNSPEPLEDHFPDLISAMEYAEEVMNKARGE